MWVFSPWVTIVLHFLAYKIKFLVTCLFVISESIDMVVDILANLVKRHREWCSNNKLTIHQDKTEAMVIMRKRFVGLMKQLKIAEGNIKFVEFSKCQGVFIDNKVSWGNKFQQSAAHSIVSYA